ncbi:MAG: pilus assembly protein PilM [Planctomycetales bacterium]|nr:pilus assembly protein PilM [Planctomycetales bacterium]
MFGIKQTGWIGIDIGTATVKLAQLSRSNNKPRLTGLAMVPRRAAWRIAELAEQTLSSNDEICAAVSLHPGFQGKLAAITPPMALCKVHTLDRTKTHDPSDERFVRAAIELATQRSADQLQFDTWDAEPEPEGRAPRRANVLTVATHWADQFFDDLRLSGWSCQAIDGLPLALARAVAMVQPKDSTAPVAALDWGFAEATLCIVLAGNPVYVRSLKACGLNRLLDKLVESLDVTTEEAQRLLHEQGVLGHSTSSPTSIQELIEEIIADPLAQLISEYQRTVSHLQCQRRSIVPKRLVLFGGGATINGIAEQLTATLETKTTIWSPGQELAGPINSTGLPGCLFGPAIALSALAWEKA